MPAVCCVGQEAAEISEPSLARCQPMGITWQQWKQTSTSRARFEITIPFFERFHNICVLHSRAFGINSYFEVRKYFLAQLSNQRTTVPALENGTGFSLNSWSLFSLSRKFLLLWNPKKNRHWAIVILSLMHAWLFQAVSSPDIFQSRFTSHAFLYSRAY
jgi:hypothetical protein